jgi:hypothetical protein
MRPHATSAGLFALAASLASSLSWSAPAAPVVTVGATDIKQLQFNWNPVAQSNYYELWFKANPGATWVKYAQTRAQRPLFRISVPVHLLDWRVAKYLVKACNPSGCTASTEVGVDGLALDAMGYIKPNGAGNNRWFGHTVTLSADGNTMAVLTGETIGANINSVVLHVYRRTTTTSGWRREARLVPPSAQPHTSFATGGMPVALSSDGNTVVLGVAGYQATLDAPFESGAVFLWRREAAGWRLDQSFAGAAIGRDWYGFNVEIDDAAETLAIWHQYVSPGQFEAGTVDVYRWRGAPDNFYQHVNNISVPILGGLPANCWTMSLSGDGKRLFRVCQSGVTNIVQVIDVATDFTWSESSRLENLGYSIGVDSTYDGKRIIVTTGSGAGVYNDTANGWVRDDVLGNGADGLFVYNHNDGTISRDGKIVALGDREGNVLGLGPVYPPYETTSPGSGAVFVYERRPAGWSLRRVVTPGSLAGAWAGHSVALGNNGKVLAVGAPLDPSAASGIDGDRNDFSAPERGAVWLY